MSHDKLLSEVPEDRRLFIQKLYNEINDNATANTSDRERKKAYFLRLVRGNRELSKIEKRYCRERYIYYFELQNSAYKMGEPRECDKCQTTRYSDKYCERCISLHLQSLFNTWTSDNKMIDDFIHQCQILSSLPNLVLE